MNHYVNVGGTDSSDCSTIFPPCATVAYAITQADNGDTIHIGAGTFGSTHLTVDKNLTFQGAGMNTTILDGDGLGTVFYLSGASDMATTIAALTITGGDTVDIAGGGGIALYSGSLTLTNVKVTGNHADWAGGISSWGTLTITDSEISDNTATSDGGGMKLEGSNLATTLTRVTISGNTAGTSGGGIKNQVGVSVIGGLSLTNVTVSGNTAHVGGGIHTTAGAYVNITNSTIAYNHLDGAAGAQDGGIGNYANLTIKNSIVAGNDVRDCWIGGGGTTWTSQGNNISSDGTCGFSNDAHNDRQNLDPRLGTLGNYGGLIRTIILRFGSPARNGVIYFAPNGCPLNDARGIGRPIAFICDIGAFEDNTTATFLPLTAK